MGKFAVLMILIVVACSSRKDLKEPLGATAEQADAQQAADEMAPNSYPATELPPAGTPRLPFTPIP